MLAECRNVLCLLIGYWFASLIAYLVGHERMGLVKSLLKP